MSTEPRPDPRSAGEIALGSLIDESASMRPDEIPTAVRRKGEIIGLEGATIYLVDKQQTVLIPFPSNEGETVQIEGSVAGRCFRQSEIIADEAEPVRLWFPVIDGTARVGVLAASLVGADTPLLRDRGRQLAGFAAELLVSKQQYGDHIVNTRRLQEMTLAAEIRWALVPPLTFINSEVTITGYLEPAYEIAGDTFDYAVNTNTVHFAIFDAVGHGMEASRIANLALLSYRHSRRRGLGLVDTYRAMSEAIEESFDRSAYATAQLATLDVPNGVLCWINAGHPTPLLIRAGESVRQLVGRPALPVGIAEELPEVHETELEPGDMVAFYSDGMVEARDVDEAPFGAERLGGLIARDLADGFIPPEIARRTVHAAVQHQGGATADDATLLLVGWRL